MGFREIFGFRKPATPSEEVTQEFTPEQLAKVSRPAEKTDEVLKAPTGPMGMQHFGYKHADGMDNFYLRKEADEKRRLKETRDGIEGA